MCFCLRFFFVLIFQKYDTVAKPARRRQTLIKAVIKDLSPRARRRQTLIKDLSENRFIPF